MIDRVGHERGLLPRSEAAAWAKEFMKSEDYVSQLAIASRYIT